MFTLQMNLRALLLLSVSLLGALPAAAGEVCEWNGVAPICDGDCRPGFTLKKRDKQGQAGSKSCLTGTKAYCCFDQVVETFGKAPLCNGTCPVGWTTVGTSDVGQDGKKCVTGHAVTCAAPIP